LTDQPSCEVAAGPTAASSGGRNGLPLNQKAVGAPPPIKVGALPPLLAAHPSSLQAFVIDGREGAFDKEALPFHW
jgi:hypothetical protein